jgi:flavin-dependent dehydrogenase
VIRAGREVDVLVIGGGPAGAAAAADLAGRGLQVMVVEQAEGPRDRVCGEFVSPEAIPLLERLGALARLGAGLPRIDRARFTAPPRGELSFPLPGAALGIRRRRLDEAVLDEAARRGAIVLRGARFRDAIRDRRAVRGAVIAGPDGEVRVGSRMLLGADGRASAVARALGLDRPAPGPPRLAVKAHFHPGPGMRGIEGRVEIHVFDGGYVGMQPVDGDLVNVSAAIDARLARAIGGGALRVLLQASGRSPAAAARLRGAEPAAPPVCLFPLDRRRAAVEGPGFLLAGDAAAVVPPFAGLGITAALRSGGLAGRAAAAALAGEPAPYLRSRRGLDRARRRSQLLERLVHRPALAAPLLGLLRPQAAAALARATRIS